MALSEDKITGRYSITAYNDDDVIINEAAYSSSLILSAQTLICPWSVSRVCDLDASNLQSVLEMNPEVVLLGTGIKQHFPGPEISAIFGTKGIGLEVMNTGALCRTFNILVAEDRDVVALILQGSAE